MLRNQKRLTLSLVPWLFLAPALVFYSAFLILPVLGTFYISLFEWAGFSLKDMTFIGLGNYIKLLEDSVFLKALLHNGVFVVVGVTAETLVALILAVLLERRLPLSNFFRGVYFIPTVMSFVVVGIVFTLFLSPSLGVINPILKSLGLGGWTYAWLGDKRTALLSVIAIHVWKQFGFSMFLFVAGLKTIPQELYEASSIDGATGWQNFCFVTLPLLRRVAAVVIMLAVIHSFKLFDLVYVMTFGGPNHASEVLTTWMYAQGFLYDKMGYGSAISVVLLVITLTITVLQLRVSEQKESKY